MSEPIKIDKYLSYHYGGASGDLNLIHIDNEFARAAGLNGIILQGRRETVEKSRSGLWSGISPKRKLSRRAALSIDD